MNRNSVYGTSTRAPGQRIATDGRAIAVDLSCETRSTNAIASSDTTSDTTSDTISTTTSDADHRTANHPLQNSLCANIPINDIPPRGSPKLNPPTQQTEKPVRKPQGPPPDESRKKDWWRLLGFKRGGHVERVKKGRERYPRTGEQERREREVVEALERMRRGWCHGR